MAPRLPIALKKKIAALQTQLAAVEQEQRAAREAARAFVTEAMARLGLTADDLAGATTRRPGRRGRLATRKAGRPRRGAAAPTSKAKAPKRAAKGAAPRGAKGRPKGGAKGTTGQKVAPKYRGPAGELWSGRGKQPRWLTALVAEGRTPQEFLIG